MINKTKYINTKQLAGDSGTSSSNYHKHLQ